MSEATKGATAAASGPITAMNSVKAARMRKGGMKGSGSFTAA